MKNFVRCVKKGGIREKIRVFCCRSLRGSVDWNAISGLLSKKLPRRSLRGSVDWNSFSKCSLLQETMSLPTRERGLKSHIPKLYNFSPKVAPYAGAWIEIPRRRSNRRFRVMSLPPRERGLKFPWARSVLLNPPSLPTRERGLKLSFFYKYFFSYESIVISIKNWYPTG